MANALKQGAFQFVASFVPLGTIYWQKTNMFSPPRAAGTKYVFPYSVPDGTVVGREDTFSTNILCLTAQRNATN
jgi:hypothetical protein